MLMKRILSFSCLQTLSVFKGFCRFPVSRHFPYSRDFVVSLFLDTFHIQGIFAFPCFQTLKLFKSVRKQEKQPNLLRKSLLSRDFVISPVSRHFPYSRDFIVSLVSRHFPYSRDFVISAVFFWKRLEG